MRFKQAQPLPKELLAALLDCEDIHQLEPMSVETIQSVERHVSAIYQVRIQFKRHKALYWIKVHPKKTGSGKEEYQFLSEGYERFLKIPHLSVIKPVVYLKDYDVVVTEHATGEPLSKHVKHRMNLIASSLKNSDEVMHYFYMCGKFLARLHDEKLPESQCYTWDQLFEYIDVRLKWLLKDWELDMHFYDRIHAYIDSIKPELSGIQLTRVKTHGDYAPYNVLVSDEELVIFDPAVGQYFGSLENYLSQYEDIVHFYKWSHEMFSPFVSRRVRQELAAQFIEGYNRNSDLIVETSSAAFEVFMLKYKLLSVFDSWPSIISKLSSKKTRIKSFEKWFDATTRRL